MAKLTFKQHSAYKNSDEEFVKVDYKRLYESQYPSEAKLNKTLEKKIKQIKGITKKQAEILLTIPQPKLMTLIQQMSQLTMGEENEKELQEKSKLVTSVEQVFDIISKKLKSEMGKRYKKSKTDGLAFVNNLAQIVGMKATDKKQAPNKMFLKMDYVDEKLDADSDAGDYVDDFRKSDAPQFKGKSDKKIQKMAIAAYLKNKDEKK